MFAYIKGELETKAMGYVIVDVAGIGYKVFMSVNSIDKLGEVGEVVKIHTHYHVREDNISLFGFAYGDELRMFELLLSVSGIGAKSAISMLSSITPSEFAIAIITNDVSKLVKIPGVGGKSAARIVLELKDKLKKTEIIEQDTKLKFAIEEDDKVSESISALQVLGYSKKEIDRVFEKLDLTNLKLEEIIKKALFILGK